MRFSVLLFFLLSMQVTLLAQNTYLTVRDPKHPENSMLVGNLNAKLLENNPACSWFSSGFKAYDPSGHSQKLQQDSLIHLVIFAGTWCEDSQFIIPRLFKWLSAEGFPENRVSLYGVDRDKRTVDDLSGAFGITNVPTIIVMKEGKELGRVVEYGKTGKWEEELSILFR